MASLETCILKIQVEYKIKNTIFNFILNKLNKFLYFYYGFEISQRIKIKMHVYLKQLSCFYEKILSLIFIINLRG